MKVIKASKLLNTVLSRKKITKENLKWFLVSPGPSAMSEAYPYPPPAANLVVLRYIIRNPYCVMLL